MTADLPSRHQVEAAIHVARLLAEPESTVQQLRESFRIVPSGGRFASRDLKYGLTLLARAKLVVPRGERIARGAGIDDLLELSSRDAVSSIMMQLLGELKPLWLRAGLLDPSGYAEEAIPYRTLNRLYELLQDPDEREALLLAAARRVDAERRIEVGRLGELGVIQAAQDKFRQLDCPELISSIRHVSLISDELGYDIVAPSATTGDKQRLEVKTCVSPRYLRVYISRAESDWALQDPAWHLVVCTLDDEGSAAIVGSLHGAELFDRLPIDPERNGHRWESASLRLQESDLTPGLSMLN